MPRRYNNRQSEAYLRTGKCRALPWHFAVECSSAHTPETAHTFAL